MTAVLRSPFVLLLLLSPFSAPGLSAQQFTCSVRTPPTDPASQAFQHKDYSKAIELYAAQSQSNPKDMEAIAGQVRSLLETQQVDAAAKLAENDFAVNARSAVLADVLGEVRYRQGRLTDANHTYRTALLLDPCLARTRYDYYRIMQIESMHASAYAQLQIAHGLEPDDADIHLAWIYTLPLAERASQIDSYLAASKNQPVDQKESMKEYADRLHAILIAKNKNGGCHLTSTSPTTTKLSFDYVDEDESNNYHGIGFNVKIDKKASALLELDTGASGILLNRRTAKKANLVSLASDKISGIGDEKDMSGYWAYADDLSVGALEFKNCMVEVSDKRSILGIDGLIGADVFEDYHVQLDFPMRQMFLSPLPTRPGEAPRTASLNSSGVGSAAATASSGKTSAAAQPAIQYKDRYISPEMKSWSPFARVGHQILVNGELKDRQPRLFLLDTGSEGSILSISAGNSVGKLHSDFDDRVMGLSGEVKKLYTVSNVDITFAGLRGPYQKIMVTSLDGLSKSDGTEVSGIIGLNTMLLLTMDVDYRDGLIHFSYDPKHGLNNRLQFIQ